MEESIDQTNRKWWNWP